MRYGDLASFIAILVVAFVCPLGEVAAEGPGQGDLKREEKRSESIFAAWIDRMENLDRRVQAGEGKRALKAADRLVAEIIELVKSGETSQLLGTLSVIRALASYNAGDQRLALWHWHIGVQMFPEFSEYNLARYGDAGLFLTEHPFQKPNSLPPAKVPAQLTPPVKKRAPPPRFPLGKHFALEEPVAVVVKAVIDKEGRLTQPVILKAEGELTLVLASLEAFRRWEFEPAKLDGKPVAAYYTLTVNFRTKWHPDR